MIQQLFREIEKIKAEIRRLRGEINRLASGGQIIPSSIPGTATVPTAVDGAIIRGNATPGWERLGASVPVADVRNVLGLDNGDLRPSWKTALDSTDPTAITEGAAADPGTSLVFAHRDHQHAVPSSFTPAAHAASHSENGTDEISVENLGSTELDTTLRLGPDGLGGVAWVSGGAAGPSYIPFGSEAAEGQVFSPV